MKSLHKKLAQDIFQETYEMTYKRNGSFASTDVKEMVQLRIRSQVDQRMWTLFDMIWNKTESYDETDKSEKTI